MVAHLAMDQNVSSSQVEMVDLDIHLVVKVEINQLAQTNLGSTHHKYSTSSGGATDPRINWFSNLITDIR